MKSVIKVSLACMILATACQDAKESSEYKSLQQRADSLQSQVVAKDQEVEEVTASITEIESNLAAIEKDELSISEIKKEGQSNDQGQKDRINGMITSIDSYIEQNRQKIEKLEQKVKASKGKNASLQKLVANLRATIAKKEAEITELRGTIAGLETEVSGLKTEREGLNRTIGARDSALSARQQMIEERETEIYSAYYITGSKRELGDAGIVDKSGGFLGLGKTTKISTRIDKSKFTTINMRNTDDINLGVTKKYKVVSSHPGDSYYTTKVGEEVHLKITDFKKFWSLTKYLVVETK